MFKITTHIVFSLGLMGLSIIPVKGQRTYYLSAAGNDRADGQSREHAWKTISKLNSAAISPGDRILFQGGAVFPGTLILKPSIAGMAKDPLLISSYGKGRAVIDAGQGDGIYARNFSGLVIRNLVWRGSGIKNNTGSGIDCFSDDTVSEPNHIQIDHCEVFGFRNYGIVFWSAAGSSVKGFDEVHLTGCYAHDNGEAGIASYAGYQQRFVHRNFYLSGCRAYYNPGIAAQIGSHSGNGIVIGSVDTVWIDHCEAFDNGRDNTCNQGGPVGIWVWLCHDALIQYCRSYDNHTGSLKDGGGFDIDGGSSDCVIQYDYSRDNDGAGYLLAEYGARLPFRHNTIRFNISLDDGRKNGYGGITVWGADSNYRVKDSYVYHNTILTGDSSVLKDIPCAVRLMGNDFSGVFLMDNIFQVRGGALLIRSDAKTDTGEIHFQCNDYFSVDSPLRVFWAEEGSITYSRWVNLVTDGQAKGRTYPGIAINPQIHWPRSNKERFPLNAFGSNMVSPLKHSGCIPNFPGNSGTKNIDFFGIQFTHINDDFIGISSR